MPLIWRNALAVFDSCRYDLTPIRLEPRSKRRGTPLIGHLGHWHARMNGYELARILRALPEYAAFP